MEPAIDLSHGASSKLNAKVVEKLETILKEKFPNKQFKYEVESASSKGDNYLGVLYRVNVIVDNDENFKLIVKVTPDNPIRRKQFFAVESFTREALVYETFFPTITEFQKSKGLKKEEIFDAFPRFYGINKDECSEALFLEDLCDQGYRIFDRFKVIDEKHVRLVMQSYGRLHATFFALQDQQPEKLEKYCYNLEEIFAMRKDEEPFLTYFDMITERALNTLNDPADAKYKDKCLKFLANKKPLLDLLKYVGEEAKDPYSVFCHGDCWNNNIMFQYNEHQQPIKATLIDWQILRYASPITDIMYYIFSSTSHKLRSEYFREMMDVYYKSLSDHVTRLGSDPDKVFPRKVFEQKLKEFGACGFYFAIMLIPMITTNPEDTPDLDEMSQKIEDGTLDPEVFHNNGSVYEERMRGILKDIVDLGFLE